MARPSTGLRPLDGLIDGVRIGDNLVFETDGEVSVDGFVSAFVRASSTAAGLAYVSLLAPPSIVLDRFPDDADAGRTVLVDLYSDGLGASDKASPRGYRTRKEGTARIERVRSAGDVDHVLTLMTALEDELGPDTRYVFDSLTGMQELWGGDAALDFFLRSCPRLYELRTIALWPLDRRAHEPSFLSRLTRITQVVVRIEPVDEGFAIRVVKAEGRPPEVVGRRATIRFESGRARIVQEQEPGTRERVGALLREGRRARGLSQAELARRIEISPSALSQAERGVAGLSGATLSRAWKELGMPFGGDMAATGPYRLSRRGSRPVRSIAKGVEAEPIADSPGRPAVFLLRFARGAMGRRAPFSTKRSEVVVLVSGALELTIGEGREVLHAGDAIEITTETISSWRNLAPQETVAVWTLVP
jgi:transcriptional regulator with XRE-family HTH domain